MIPVYDTVPREIDWEDPPALHEECGADVRIQRAIDEWIVVADAAWFPKAPTEKSTKDRFLELANIWQRETRHISSVKDITSHPSYQAIIALGWDAVPFLLEDLQTNQRFWFPALNAVTGIRPFDSADAGNGRRMTKAWVDWGRRRKFIK